GLPRSGSTLLANILLQHPRIHVTSAPGLLDMLIAVRKHWDKNGRTRTLNSKADAQVKERVLKALAQACFSCVEKPICIDKDLYWAEFLEMAAVLVGGREYTKVLVTVRDLREVCASFERLYRKAAALGPPPLGEQQALRCKTARGRFEYFMDDLQPVGRAFNAIRDAVTRGWRSQMHFVEYDRLTAHPRETLEDIYRFLGEAPTEHNFNRVEQVTVQDDFVYGFKELHSIHEQVEPRQPTWHHVFDDDVYRSNVWACVEDFAQFWTLYDDGPRSMAVTAVAD
ncbi:MAG TPA: sulfotransferase, partial [Gammaproteobacteria bacterium]|nr:sulfotransferase [Gammaproteobacteria bacterium]